MLKIARNITIPDHEIEISAVRARGAGGQNVNKVSSAVHLRFDTQASSLPEAYKQKLLQCRDRRITREGIIIIKAREFRSQEKNRTAALERLQQLIRRAVVVPGKRIPTKPSRSSKSRRLASKIKHGQLKRLRGKSSLYE